MRVLFVGNSHTFYNGMPYMVRHMLRCGGVADAEVFMVAPNAKPLTWHAQEATTRCTIRCHPWDRIVLQQQSHPFAGYDALAKDYEGLEPHLTYSGAKICFCMTWCRKDQDEKQPELDEAFIRLAREKQLTLAPVSRAWTRAKQLLPEVDLYQPDRSHASAAGSYIAACVYYMLFAGDSPEGQDARIEAGGQVLAEFAPEVAGKLQQCAKEAVDRLVAEEIHP